MIVHIVLNVLNYVLNVVVVVNTFRFLSKNKLLKSIYYEE